MFWFLGFQETESRSDHIALQKKVMTNFEVVKLGGGKCTTFQMIILQAWYIGESINKLGIKASRMGASKVFLRKGGPLQLYPGATPGNKMHIAPDDNRVI